VLTELELDELIRQLKDRRRSPDLLWDRIVDQMGSRIWKSAEWRKRRAAVIKSSCVDCGATDGPFTLQHRAQPPRPSDVLRKYSSDPSNPDGFPQWFERDPDRRRPTEVQRAACPRCGGTNLAKYEGTRAPFFAGWQCKTQRNRKVCGHRFTKGEAGSKMVTPRDPDACHDSFTRYLRSDSARRLKRVAALEVIEHYREYISLRNTATLCRACAYSADVLGGVSCCKCGKGTRSAAEIYCSACSPSWRTCECCASERQAQGWAPARHRAQFSCCYDCFQKGRGEGATAPQVQPPAGDF
jgi:hypothetical protein